MVTTYGNNIISAFTEGTSVKAIYTKNYNYRVWPDYTLTWSPTDISGSFIIGGEVRWLQDYSGVYNGPFLSSKVLINKNELSFKYLDISAFMSTGITEVYTTLEWVNEKAFQNCTSLYTVSMPYARLISAYAFSGCSNLRNVELPSAQFIAGYAFNGCRNLIKISLPECLRLTGFNVFAGCSNLQSVYLPKCKTINWNAMAYIPKLSSIELPVCQDIGESAFYSCSNLNTITLGYSGIVSHDPNIFLGTQITQNTGSIYVPASLVLKYRSDSGWSYYSAIIQPIPPTP